MTRTELQALRKQQRDVLGAIRPIVRTAIVFAMMLRSGVPDMDSLPGIYNIADALLDKLSGDLGVLLAEKD